MVLDPLKVKAAIETGLSPVCATCKKHWAAQDEGRDTCTLPGEECGGPIAGLDFPLYDGPMSSLEKACFACISPAEFVVRPVGKERFIGVCRTHMGYIDRMVPKDGDKPVVEVRSPKGLILPRNGWYTEKTLKDHLAEDEADNG